MTKEKKNIAGWLALGGVPWTVKEVQELRRLLEKGKSQLEISRELKRSLNSVRHKIQALKNPDYICQPALPTNYGTPTNSSYGAITEKDIKELRKELTLLK